MSADKIVIDPAIRAEIEALIVEHAWRVDHHQCHDLADLYTEDGRFLGAGPDKIGRAAIEAYGRERAAMTKRQARHVCTNFRMIWDGPDRIRGGCVITLFRSDGEVMGTADAVAVADAEDIYAKCPDGRWRIQQRRIVLAFESAAHRA
jgi:ketosteroid isomerase-like protein